MRWIVLACIVLAGCADATSPEPVQDGPDVEVTKDTGGICGVVVDQAIVPVGGVTITITGDGETITIESDDEGRFCKGTLRPGFYTLEATKPGYSTQSLQVEAEAGVERPPLARIQIERLFDQDPFISQFKFEGRLACHVQAGLTAPCVTDWTQILPPCGSGCVPPLRTVMGDARDFMDEIEGGWQSHIVEMTWRQSSQATSKEMGLIIRDFEVGGATHQFGEMEGESPLWIHLKEGQVHATQGGGEPTMIPSEGYDRIIHFAGVRTAQGDLVAAAIEQKFEVFRHTFYYANAPEEWSFLAGDDMPF